MAGKNGGEPVRYRAVLAVLGANAGEVRAYDPEHPVVKAAVAKGLLAPVDPPAPARGKKKKAAPEPEAEVAPEPEQGELGEAADSGDLPGE